MGEVYWVCYCVCVDGGWEMLVELVLLFVVQVLVEGCLYVCGNGLLVYVEYFSVYFCMVVFVSVQLQVMFYVCQVVMLGQVYFSVGLVLLVQQVQLFYLCNKVVLIMVECEVCDVVKGVV